MDLNWGLSSTLEFGTGLFFYKLKISFWYDLFRQNLDIVKSFSCSSLTLAVLKFGFWVLHLLSNRFCFIFWFCYMPDELFTREVMSPIKIKFTICISLNCLLDKPVSSKGWWRFTLIGESIIGMLLTSAIGSCSISIVCW